MVLIPVKIMAHVMKLSEQVIHAIVLRRTKERIVRHLSVQRITVVTMVLAQLVDHELTVAVLPVSVEIVVKMM